MVKWQECFEKFLAPTHTFPAVKWLFKFALSHQQFSLR